MVLGNMRVLVCGSRHFKDKELLDKVLKEYPDITDLIHGAARGADTLAMYWAMNNLTKDGRYIRLWAFPADWEKHGKAAGPIRNSEMLERGKPDLVIAFLAPGSRGTADMVRQAKEAGVPVKIINIME